MILKLDKKVKKLIYLVQNDENLNSYSQLLIFDTFSKLHEFQVFPLVSYNDKILFYYYLNRTPF